MRRQVELDGDVVRYTDRHGRDRSAQTNSLQIQLSLGGVHGNHLRPGVEHLGAVGVHATWKDPDGTRSSDFLGWFDRTDPSLADLVVISAGNGSRRNLPIQLSDFRETRRRAFEVAGSDAFRLGIVYAGDAFLAGGFHGSNNFWGLIPTTVSTPANSAFGGPPPKQVSKEVLDAVDAIASSRHPGVVGLRSTLHRYNERSGAGDYGVSSSETTTDTNEQPRGLLNSVVAATLSTIAILAGWALLRRVSLPQWAMNYEPFYIVLGIVVVATLTKNSNR